MHRLQNGAIVSGGNGSGLLYTSEDIQHLPFLAKRRLAELHNNQPNLDYEAAEQILIEEGLYDPVKDMPEQCEGE